MDYFDMLTHLIMSGVQEQLVDEMAECMAELLERGLAKPEALSVLSSLSKTEAEHIVAKHSKSFSKDSLDAFKLVLAREDEELVQLFNKAFYKRDRLTTLADNIANNAAVGMSDIMRRQNIAFADTQADLWYKVVADAILREQSGEARKQVMERAVRELSLHSLDTIDYLSGKKTRIDAAIRRHIVTQGNQARNRLLFARMDEWEYDLVFVSAHFGARPDHAEWQGKVFSRSGKSKKYPSLVDVTGYGTVTGLCGANCRHTMTPYVPGYSKLPNTDYSSQEKITGMSSEEYYSAVQKQRRYEASIRDIKRNMHALELKNVDTTAEKLKLRAKQKQIREYVKENKLQRDYDREKLWGIKEKKHSHPANLDSPRVVRHDINLYGYTREERNEFIGSKFERQILGKSIKRQDLKPARIQGKTKYAKPLRSFKGKGEKRELQVHEILNKHGLNIVALPEYEKNVRHGIANIDLIELRKDSDRLIEIKCPNLEGDAKSTSVGYIDRSLKSMRKQFDGANHPLNRGDVVGVLSLIERPYPVGAAYTLDETIAHNMLRHGVSELYVILDNETVFYYGWQ